MLGQDLTGWRVLDAFGGSGLMAFEALSRGAESVTINERSRRVAAGIQKNCRLLGVQPAVGRAFREDEATAGNDAVVILSDGLWAQRYGSDPDVIGNSIVLDDQPYTIIGVMPPRFEFPPDADDVDGGQTTLTSPLLDLGADPDPQIGYWRWFSNPQGVDPNTDVLVVEITDDGSNWIPVEIVGRDGVTRRYTFEDAIRLYQRRVTFAPIRYRDAELVGDQPQGHGGLSDQPFHR